MPDAYIEAMEAAVAQIVADMRREQASCIATLRQEQAAEIASIRHEHALRLAEMDVALSLFKARAGEAEARYAAFELRAEAEQRERLAALKDGRDGIDGKDGAPGKDGVDGRDGADGENGRDGVDGKDGVDGTDAKEVDIASLVEAVARDFSPRLDLIIADVQERISARLLELKDGAPGRDGVDGRDGKDGDDGRDGIDGKDAAPIDMEAVAALVSEAVEAKAVAALAVVERMASERLAVVKDGKDGIDGKDGEPGRDGVDADPDKIVERVSADIAARLSGFEQTAQAQVANLVAEARAAVDEKLAAVRDGVDGKDADEQAIIRSVTMAVDARIDEIKRTVSDGAAEALTEIRSKLAEVKDGRDGKDGKMPIAREWTDGVHYAGDIVIHAGGTWQATRDTAKEPPHGDWACLAAPGAHAKGFVVCGTYDPEAEYAEKDVVMTGGSSFVALRDAPGPCPGDGWQLWASKGSRGAQGERGQKGDMGSPGRDAVEVVSLYRDGDEIVLTTAEGREMRA